LNEEERGGKTMNKNWIYRPLVVIVVLTLFSVSQVWAQSRSVTKTPIITHAFAVDKGYYGYIWKIYVEAEDPNGEMLRIALSVDQPGYGHYPTDWIYLSPQYQKHFKGYIQWNTFSSKAPYLTEWSQITLKVSVFDKAGNESNEVVFPFTFESGVKNSNQYELPAPFNEGNIPKLGNVSIDLFEPSLMGSGGSSIN
jgi:hypothetical protein